MYCTQLLGKRQQVAPKHCPTLALAWGTLEVERVLSGTGSRGLAALVVAQVRNPCGLSVCSLPLTQGLDPHCPTLAGGLVRGGSQQTQEWRRSPLTFCLGQGWVSFKA